MFIPKGKTWELGEKIKSAANVPVIFVGKIHSKQDIEELETNYQADYIAFGRALVADPDFAGKVLNQVSGLIRPCMACAEGCLGGVRAGKGLGCVVNPLTGHEEEEIHSATNTKSIAIVGGGLAGMQAALTLNQRGHKVTMYEKEELGGQYNLAHLPPLKDSLKEIVDYYKQEITDNHISINYKEAQVEDLLEGKYNEVVLASGAVPVIPPIKGLKKYFWTEFLHDEHLPSGKKVMIVGGGLIGIELASKLTDQGNEVVVVEMLEEVARGMEAIEKAMTLKKLQARQVKIFNNTKVTEVIHDKTAVLSGPDQTFEIENIDHFVMATGMRAYHPLSEKLEGKIPYHLVGDAIKPDKAQTAIRSAFELANKI
jgi:NADPH-dependent 2,4-dienoyl-CoA reductase/sulfur reductase-like enzyme